MTARSMRQFLSSAIRDAGYGRGYRYSGMHDSGAEWVSGLDAIARCANPGETWLVDVMATMGKYAECAVDHLTVTFPRSEASE